MNASGSEAHRDLGLTERAAAFARAAHGGQGQVRKYTGEPYAIHLEAVATRVSAVLGATEEMVAAAWLHDVLEDVPGVTPEQLEAQFGPAVRDFVVQLTDVSRPSDGNRRVRKALDRDHLALASPEGQTIKLADLLDNAESILARDRAFSNTFLREMAELVSVMPHGDPDLRQEALALLDQRLGPGTPGMPGCGSST